MTDKKRVHVFTKNQVRKLVREELLAEDRGIDIEIPWIPEFLENIPEDIIDRALQAVGIELVDCQSGDCAFKKIDCKIYKWQLNWANRVMDSNVNVRHCNVDGVGTFDYVVEEEEEVLRGIYKALIDATDTPMSVQNFKDIKKAASRLFLRPGSTNGVLMYNIEPGQYVPVAKLYDHDSSLFLGKKWARRNLGSKMGAGESWWGRPKWTMSDQLMDAQKGAVTAWEKAMAAKPNNAFFVGSPDAEDYYTVAVGNWLDKKQPPKKGKKSKKTATPGAEVETTTGEEVEWTVDW